MPYQVGDLQFYTQDDPTFETRVEAETDALKKALTDMSPVGVWTSQEEGSELVSIAHEGELFRKRS